MADEITHFIWGYQRYFRIGQESSARQLFALLDSRFDPEVYLVGLLLPGNAGPFPACVEPEDDFWIDSEAFNDALAQAVPRIARYPEAALFHSHPVAQQSHNDFLFRRAIQDELGSILAARGNHGLEYFVSLPEVVGGFAVSVVLGLQQNVLRQHHRLTSDRVFLHELRSYPVARSLIEAAVSEFFQDAAEELRKVEPGLPSSKRGAEEILRAAGRQLTHDTALRVDQNTIEGWHSLFGRCNALSSMRYEREVGGGQIVLATKEHLQLTRQVVFKKAVPLKNLRGTRKLLELTSAELALHSDSESLFGLAALRGYSNSRENLFAIRFVGDGHWELAHADQVLMRVRDGQPYLPQPRAYAAKLAIDLRRIFRPLEDTSVELIVGLVQEAEREARGTTLLISAAAEAEARRLENPGVLIEPVAMTPALLRTLIRIDGAVILDPEGRCHAVGVILDGLAAGSGSPARGARFNSAVRYVQSFKGSCLAVILSEDGGVDLIPDFPPPISRSLIDRAVEELRGIAQRQEIPLRRYYRVRDWLGAHKFYLRSDDAVAINALVTEIEARMDREDPYRIKLIYSELVANPELDEDFFYETQVTAAAEEIEGV